ncbi:2-hydroxycarboxylate transporter family protein, partial [Escherichia coli]|uniref:2-hydroxycarboxylate transporter family protein n=1 Tax=Escherichia coli TaxID=562 RepID=UPI003D30F5A3
GMLVGIGVGTLLGMEPFQVFFFIVLPIMAGGVGEGAIPLSMGYAALMHMEQGVALGRVLPSWLRQPEMTIAVRLPSITIGNTRPR